MAAPAGEGARRVRRRSSLFPLLQQQRHEADYDHLADVSRAKTLRWVDGAEDAIAKLHRQRGTAEHTLLTAHLLLKASTRA